MEQPPHRRQVTSPQRVAEHPRGHGIDALEWLREVEEALESIQDWHPHWQRYIYDPDAGARYDDALLELAHIVENAREAVES